MEQVTQPTTPAAPTQAREPEPPGATVLQAHQMAGVILGQLTTSPRDIGARREITGEYSVNVFWSGDVSGVRALASWADSTWELVPNHLGRGVFAETRPRVDGVQILAWAILNPDEAAAAEQLLAVDRATPPAPAAPDTDAAPVPLGESPVAQDDTALYVQSMDRYAASLGGSVVAQVPAVEAPVATDDPSTIAFAPVAPAAGGDR
ncbi:MULTISPECIES: hypothetical protein [Streptomyces]|uniref:hypothetical protein n=1 Tax=Streptomyces TaxID=1883 RepID=UPI0029A35985|nr:hypothetical protein [Streptomyces stelliscabiei]MDX2520538.1 hypothetical protein [Streptomyces stelliscabiei]MDX2552635.1 hypothetical protein [Streptomyces stelliscabiei]MDX2661319.1 hypothetical protein [Streptomyces stelliscabiei]MDX2788800.1 hypothetical protein [Streptomyces stelliscabiei]